MPTLLPHDPLPDSTLALFASAAPEALRATLFGKGGVQGLDGQAHRHRKALFLQVLTPEAVAALAMTAQQLWEDAAARWHPDEPVVPYEEAQSQDGDEQYLLCFLQEVRRHSPFFPAVAGRVKRDAEWNGYLLRQGRRVLLDLHGTNHDPRTWTAPNEFRPERFLDRTPSPYAFVPQGGGTAEHHHRCPGEGLAVALMAAAVRGLLPHLDTALPPQDLRTDHRRLPALPRSHLVIAVRPRAARSVTSTSTTSPSTLATST